MKKHIERDFQFTGQTTTSPDDEFHLLDWSTKDPVVYDAAVKLAAKVMENFYSHGLWKMIEDENKAGKPK